MPGDDPVIFKRTKSKPAQTTRAKSPDTSETALTGGEESPITLASKLKNKAKKSKSKSRLSFGGDDEVCVLLHGRTLC
jgi:GC-rich sequence DNA-binding factor